MKITPASTATPSTPAATSPISIGRLNLDLPPVLDFVLVLAGRGFFFSGTRHGERIVAVVDPGQLLMSKGDRHVRRLIAGRGHANRARTARRSRQGRLAFFQLGHHFGHRLVAIVDLLGDHLPEDRIDLLGHVVAQLAQVRDRIVVMSDQLGIDRLAAVGGLADEQVMQCAAEAVDVGPGVGVLGAHALFGGHVIHGSHDRAGARKFGLSRHRRPLSMPSQTHIENLDRALRCRAAGWRA